LVSPVTRALVADAAALYVVPPGCTVIVYPVIGEPPLLEGAAHVTVICAFPGATDVIVGAGGGPVGVTAVDAAEAGPVPAALVAVTVNVYEVPLLRPVTVADVGVTDAVAVAPPGDAVTV